MTALNAEAASLRSWRFDENRNRLEFTTDSKIQPRAQLVTNPTRLVIDLPGVTFGRPVVSQLIGDVVRSVRVGQFDPQTTRIVIELAPGYTMDPQQLVVRGSSATQWSVQLPPPQALPADSVSPATPEEPPTGVAVTPAAPPGSSPRSPLIFPPRPTASPIPSLPNPGNPNSTPASGPLATIQSVELERSTGQLVIQSDGPIMFTTGWDNSTGLYRVTIPSAQLASNVAGPELPPNGPFLRVRLRQDDDRTVSILMQPSAGTQILGANQLSTRLLAVQTQRSRRPPLNWPGTSGSNNSGTIGLPPTQPNQPPLTMPRPPRGRLVVVLDPGHGGRDPGAVGIGGLREVDVVMPISFEIARILEQNGIQVVMTRRTDVDLDLAPRVAIAQRARATVFVSIHANAISMSRPEVNGLETFYASAQSEPLARLIQDSMLQATGMRSRGVKRARFYVIRQTTMPSVLVETGFVTGQEDAPRLADPQFRSLLAQAIARGILEYLQQSF